ncbi:6251_t:CDS:2, partial [Dentiscutata erythropus]
EMQRYIVASRINVAPGAGQVAGREEAFGLVISCLAGPALNWYNTRIKGKNWRCNNLSDNLGVATLTAVRAIGAGNGSNQIGGLNTAGEFCNKAGAKIGRIGAGVTTGDMGVEEFSTQIKKVGKLAGMIPEQQRKQFICGLNPMNQYNIRMMAKFEDTQENITKALAEVEKFTLSQRNASSSLPAFLAANLYIDTNKSGITKTKIVNLIKTAMASSESQMAQQNADLQSTIKSFQETMSRATKTLDNSKKSSKKRAEDTAINRFLSDLLRKNLGKHSADKYDHDLIEDISDSLAGLTLNSVIKTATSKTSLKETIRKVLQSELKLIFPDHLSQDPIKANILNQQSELRAKSFSDSHMDSSDSIRSFLIEVISSYKTSSKEFWQEPPAEIL